MKKIIFINIFIISVVITISLINVVPNRSSVKEIDTTSFFKYDSVTYIGYLKIPCIDMELGFYDYDHSLNDVSKNIYNIKTNIPNTYLLAAHSGIGNIAYFNDLANLVIGDLIYLEFKEETLVYEVSKIRKEVKDGNITIPNKSGLLILTTCDQLVKGYQLVIEAKVIE